MTAKTSKIKKMIADRAKEPGRNDTIFSHRESEEQIPKSHVMARAMEHCAKALGTDYPKFIAGNVDASTRERMWRVETELATLLSRWDPSMSDGAFTVRVGKFLELRNTDQSPEHQLAVWGLQRAVMDLHHEDPKRLPASIGVESVKAGLFDIKAVVEELKRPVEARARRRREPELHEAPSIFYRNPVAGTQHERDEWRWDEVMKQPVNGLSVHKKEAASAPVVAEPEPKTAAPAEIEANWVKRVAKQAREDGEQIAQEEASKAARSDGNIHLRREEQVKADLIIDKVAELFGMTPEQVKTYGRASMEPRNVAVYLVRRSTGFSANSIGLMFGGYTNQNVSAIVHKVENGDISDKAADILKQAAEELNLRIEAFKPRKPAATSSKVDEMNLSADELREKFRNCYGELCEACNGTKIASQYFKTNGMTLDPSIFRAKADQMEIAVREAGIDEKVLPVLNRFRNLHEYFTNAYRHEQSAARG